VPFLEKIKSPIVACNIDDSQEPSFHGKFSKSIVVERSGRQIGVVGVTTRLATGNRRNLKILPEVESVKKEVDKLTEQGIKIIIVLSHCGLDVDREIARTGGAIDIIVGGHSHSFLYTGTPVGPDTPVSDYPTIEKQEDGREVLIVQASAYNKYLGNITLYFDADGEIKSHEGAPIFLANEILQDPEIIEELKPWKEEVDKYQTKKVGRITFSLDQSCLDRECGMGNLLTDAMVHSVS
jgi:5'-nucleotidase